MPSNAVYTGQAMMFLEGFATSAFNTSKAYLDELNNFVSQEILLSPPSISVNLSPLIQIDPALAAEKPTPPDPSSFPSVPTEPVTGEHDFPTMPSYTLPDAPTLTDIIIPEFIEGTIASITSSLPSMDFDVPAMTSIENFQPGYDSLFTTILSKLESNILNGGTMLNPLVEADIWQRDLERNEQALQDAIDKLTGQWAKLGWSLPDGLLAGGVIALQNEYTNKLLDRSREIAVKQAELEQQGLFKSLELGISIENIVMTSANAYASRVLEASKITADVTISIFRERISRYNTMLEAFKTDIMHYKTSIEAESLRAETYKARLSGAQILANIDESRIKVYSAHIGAIGQLVDVYNTQVKAVAVMYDVERQKIEKYKAQIEAYVSTIDGIVKRYSTEMETYKSYIQAWVATSDSQTKLLDVRARADIAELEATIKEWEIQLRLIQEATNVKLEALKTVATVSSNLAAGALSAVHASVSDSYNQAYSTAYQYQYQGLI